MKGQTPQMGGVPDNPEAKIPGYYKKLEAGQTREEIISEWMRKQQRKSAAYDAGNVEEC